MSTPDRTEGLPRRILLATDLSARGDRALERALQLATDWQAQLTILHVFEQGPQVALFAGDAPPSWQHLADAPTLAKMRIRQGLRADVGDAAERAIVVVEEGDPAQVIGQTAVSTGAELIITGIASEQALAREPVVLGKSVERLLRRAAIPILIVRNRARTAYEHILVASDLSATSGYAIQAALRFFPSQTLHLLHAFEAPYASKTADPARYERSYAEVLKGDVNAFLDSIFIPDELRPRLEPFVEHGQPADLVCAYVRDRGADLVVLGTHGRSAVLETLTGSTAKDILSKLPCDALVVRRPLANRAG